MENLKKTWFEALVVMLCFLVLSAGRPPDASIKRISTFVSLNVHITAFYRNVSWERDQAGHRFIASVTECKVIAPKKGQPKLITIYHDQSQPIPEPWRTIGNRATIRLDRDDLKYRKIPIAAVAKVVWNLPQGR